MELCPFSLRHASELSATDVTRDSQLVANTSELSTFSVP